jgi:ketosteroid isomerase-like protein
MSYVDDDRALDLEKREILRNIRELESAENRKDIEGILDLITDDFILVHHSAKFVGKASIREWLERNIGSYVSSRYEPAHIEVSSSGNMAWLMGTEINKRVRGQGVVERRENHMIIFRKVNGKWKQAAVQVTK